MRNVILTVSIAGVIAWSGLVMAQGRRDPNSRNECAAVASDPPDLQVTIVPGVLAQTNWGVIDVYLRTMASCSRALKSDLDGAWSALLEDDGDIRDLKADAERDRRDLEDLDARVEALERADPSNSGTNSARIAALEQSLAEVQKELAGTKAELTAARFARNVVRAPFAVVNATNETILLVNDNAPLPPGMTGVATGVFLGRSTAGGGQVAVRNGGEALAVLQADVPGGFVGVYRPGDETARVRLRGDNSQVGITDGQDHLIATMHDESTEGPFVALLSRTGTTLAGLRVNSTGGGSVFGNRSDGMQGFIAGGQGTTGADACVNTDSRGLVCLRGLFFR